VCCATVAIAATPHRHNTNKFSRVQAQWIAQDEEEREIERAVYGVTRDDCCSYDQVAALFYQRLLFHKEPSFLPALTRSPSSRAMLGLCQTAADAHMSNVCCQQRYGYRLPLSWLC
jgi:hypothetical protein